MSTDQVAALLTAAKDLLAARDKTNESLRRALRDEINKTEALTKRDKLTEFAELIARMNTQEEFGDVQPETEDSKEVLDSLIATARKLTGIKPEAAEDGPIRYRNYYRCSNDNTEWTDEWSCQCNDRCPTCNAEIEPYESEEL